ILAKCSPNRGIYRLTRYWVDPITLTLADLFHLGYGTVLGYAKCDLMTTKGPNISRWWNDLLVHAVLGRLAGRNKEYRLNCEELLGVHHWVKIYWSAKRFAYPRRQRFHRFGKVLPGFATAKTDSPITVMLGMFGRGGQSVLAHDFYGQLYRYGLDAVRSSNVVLLGTALLIVDSDVFCYGWMYRKGMVVLTGRESGEIAGCTCSRIVPAPRLSEVKRPTILHLAVISMDYYRPLLSSAKILSATHGKPVEDADRQRRSRPR
ncbi:hypothetical protein C8J57DRAFT_1246196, partial [Mycena rebaudengoi]